MKKYLPIIIVLSIIKLVIQLIGNRNYGFHRDELLHLSVSENLDWGFMEFPPLIGVIGKISYLLFDYSLVGMRLFSTLAGVAILVLCCMIAREFGGKSKAVLLSGICILAFLPFYRNHTLFQPVAFDQLFWTLGFYFLIKYINTDHKKFLIALGITTGLGLMAKYTILVWSFGLFVGLIFYKKGKLLKNKWLYISVLIALLIFLPNLLWQIQNDLPILNHFQTLKNNQLDEIEPWQFGLAQLEFPFTLAISIVGLLALLASKLLKKYSFIATASIVITCTLWLFNSKAYYVFAIYPVLFSAGAVMIESLLAIKPIWIYVIAGITFLPSVYFIPKATPILPIEIFVEYYDIKEQNGRIALTSDYADMFGWEEQVQLVDSVYQSLAPSERKNTVIWAENYGEAGALKILGNKYNLPDPICRHGSFWTWGYGNQIADVWISVGNEKPVLQHVFEEFELVKLITHKYAIDEENGIPLYICRKPKVDIEKWWRDYEEFIFE